MDTWEYTDGQGNKKQVTGDWSLRDDGILIFRGKYTREFILAVKEWRDLYQIGEEE